MVTGELMPVPKRPGDSVLGGTLNEDGAFRFRATKVGNETARADRRTRAPGPGLQAAHPTRSADRVAAVFVPVILGIAALTFVLWKCSSAGPP